MPTLETRLRAIHGPHFSVHRTLLGLWVAIGALVASAPGVQAEEGQQRYTSRTTPHVTCVTRHGRHRTSPALHVTRKTRSRRLAVAPLHHGATRCTMEHHDATGVTTPRQTVKASPHRHKWMLSHGAPADPSDPWNSHAAPVSPPVPMAGLEQVAVRLQHEPRAAHAAQRHHRLDRDDGYERGTLRHGEGARAAAAGEPRRDAPTRPH